MLKLDIYLYFQINVYILSPKINCIKNNEICLFNWCNTFISHLYFRTVYQQISGRHDLSLECLFPQSHNFYHWQSKTQEDDRMWLTGTQHLSAHLGHFNILEAPNTWVMKETRTSCLSSSHSTVLPTYHLWSYTAAMYCLSIYCFTQIRSSETWTKEPVVSAEIRSLQSSPFSSGIKQVAYPRNLLRFDKANFLRLLFLPAAPWEQRNM